MAAIIPSDAHASGDAGHTTDHNNIADMLGLLTQTLAGIAGKPGNIPPAGNAANVTAVQALASGTDIGLQPSGDTTGTTDTAAINNMLGATAGAVANLGAGTFYVKSDILLQAAGQQLAGQAIKGTTLQPVAGGAFTHGMVAITADRCGVHDILFKGGSGTITANPAATAIWINGAFHTFLEFIDAQYINGWVVDLQSTGSSTSIKIHGVDALNCAGHININGAAGGSAASVGAMLSDCRGGQIGVSTGPFANLDGLRITDAYDITGTNLNFGAGSGTTGHAFHLIGHVNMVWLSVIDCGGFPFPAVGSGSSGFVCDSGSSTQNSVIHVSHATFQTFDIGARIKSSGTGGIEISFNDCTFAGNMSHGVSVESPNNGRISFVDCQFGGTQGNNGAGGGTAFSYTATSASPAVFTATGSAFANGMTVQLVSGAPTGFSNATTYFVVNASGTTFNLSATSGGTAINSTSTGSGTLNLAPLYDLNWAATTGSGTVRGCRFNSAIVAAGTVGVQSSVNNASAGLCRWELNEFATGTNNYVNAPTKVIAAP